MDPSCHRLLFFGRFLITNSILLFVINLFRFSLSGSILEYHMFLEITHFLFMCLIGKTWNDDIIIKIVVYSLGCISFLT